MNITKLPNGNLQMEADTLEREDISDIIRLSSSGLVAESQFIIDLLPDYEQVTPEEVGALTSAPIISDGEHLWCFMNYAVESFLESLAAGKPVVWQKG